MKVVKFLLKHGLIVFVLALFTLLMTFVMGQFVTLHPDAYQDILISVMVVYLIVLLVMLVGRFLSRYQHVSLLTPLSRIKSWYKNSGVLINIAIGFTVITVINSIMMLTGLDTPKTGSFAYLHLLTRLFILVVVVVLVMYKDVLAWFKSMRFDHMKPSNIVEAIKGRVWVPSFMLFTVFTTMICLLMLIASTVITVESGALLYWLLLVMYGVLLLGLYLFKIWTQRKIRKAYND